MSNRSNYQNLLNEIETEYPVNEWKHNGYHLWPILRVRLMLMLLRQNEKSRYSPSVLKGNDLFGRIKNFLASWLQFMQLRGNIDTLYCGAPSHRVSFRGKSFNRYFDPMMDKDNNQSLLLEYSGTFKNDYYKQERVLLISDFEKCFAIIAKIRLKTKSTNQHVSELDSIIQAKGFDVKGFATETNKHIANIDRAIIFWNNLLVKAAPKKIYQLCYYSTIMMGLNISAERLGIPTIDMQHGPYHWAYKSWQAVPEKGYEMLPDEFHAWDQASASKVEQWARNSEKHKAVVSGNPWVEGWKKGEFLSSGYKYPERIVLYTLQPSDNPLEPYLLETIKQTCDDLNWWLRLHPRQAGELSDIENKLRENNLLTEVNISDATNLPLPEILLHTKVHLTKFSGCTIEAFSFGKPTILIDKRGLDIFEDYLGYNMLQSCTDKDSELLKKQINTYL